MSRNLLLFLTCIIFVSLHFLSTAANQETETRVDFGYDGYNGPQNWHLLKGSSMSCKNGKKQSPIDITSEDLAKLASAPYPKFIDLKETESTNIGTTVEFKSPEMENVTIEIKGKSYKLSNFHFHTPSEHRINGKYYDVEQHMVFESVDGEGRNAVVSILYDTSTTNSSFMDPIINNIPKEKCEKKKVENIELTKLLCDINYINESYTYSGSLTTPPCTEGVTWYVNVKPLNIGMDQLLILRDVTGFNSRFVQQRFDKTKKKRAVHKHN